MSAAGGLTYVRACVEIDRTKPLVPGVIIKKGDEEKRV